MSNDKCYLPEDAIERIEAASGHCVSYLHTSNAESNITVATIHSYVETVDYVGIGVYYQRCAMFEFWGFVSGSVLRDRCGVGSIITIDRRWCTPTAIGCHSSFDMYSDYTKSINPDFMNMDDVRAAVFSRVRLFESMARCAGRDVECGTVDYRQLHLHDDAAVQYDLISYRVILMFVLSRQHRMESPSDNAAFISVWYRAEAALFRYRVSHMTRDNIKMLLHDNGYAGRIETIDCDREYGLFMSRYRRENPITAKELQSSTSATFDKSQPTPYQIRFREYADSMRAYLPLGQTRYCMPFEYAMSLVRSRDVLMNRGFVYCDESLLCGLVSDVAARINKSNIEANRANQTPQWETDSRMRSIQREFIPIFTEAIKSYDVTLALPAMSSASTDPQRIDKVVAAAPLCMSGMLDRAMNLNNTTTNKYADREHTILYMMRMGVTPAAAKERIRKKVVISYENKNEWKSIEMSINANVKKVLAPKSGTPFTPTCSFIVGPNSNMSCPYAVKLSSEFPGQQWVTTSASGRETNELIVRSKRECHEAWEASAGAKVHQWPAKTPDEYTSRLILQRETSDPIPIPMQQHKRKA